VEEITIWRTAKLIIDVHGRNAEFEAARRANDAGMDGNRRAESVWKRIWRAIAELQRLAPETGELVN